jgi:hypothetical protein
VRGGIVVVAIAMISAMTFASSAAAVSGRPINIGTPLKIGGAPAVAVDSSGTAYIVWNNQEDLGGSPDVVQYCTLPAGATGCTHHGTLVPADSACCIDGVQVVVDGSTVVVLADVFGAVGANARHFEPEQEWESTDGGATFNLVNGGLSVASANLNADTGPLNALILPGTGLLGYGWNTAGGSPPTFNAFPLASPPECSEASPCAFASLAPNTQPDQIGNAGGELAAQSGSSPGVLAIYNTLFTNGNLGCPISQPTGTAFAYASGNQSATNSYNISPGSANSAWTVAIAQADCSVERPAVAGGPSGFGVIEYNDVTGDIVYHGFDQAHLDFDTAEVPIFHEAELYPALSQDGAGGIYATYLGGGAGGPITLSYSGNGGAAWTSAVINPNTDLQANQLNSSVGPTGQGWSAWIDNGSVFAQQFVASDAVPPPAMTAITTNQVAATLIGASLTVPAGTIFEQDHAVVTGANAGSATGTVSYALYSRSSCTAASKVFNGGTVAVAAGNAPASAAVTTALEPGKYYWQAVYSGDATNLASTSACGSEVLTIVPATSTGAGGTSNGKTITVTVSCVSTPCTVTITITFTETLAADTATSARKRHTKTITLASATFQIRHGGRNKLAAKLTGSGKALLAAHHGRLTATIVVADHTPGGLEKTTGRLKLTTVRPPRG